MSNLNKNKSVIFFPGVTYPYKCGVGHYTYNLWKKFGSRAYLLVGNNYKKCIEPGILTFRIGFKGVWDILGYIKKYNAILNIQYPSWYFSRNFSVVFVLLLNKICGRNKIVLTLHEYSKMMFLKRFLIQIIIILSDWIIFTSYDEQKIVSQKKLFLKKHFSTILIPPNFQVIGKIRKARKFDEIEKSGIIRISSFGLFYPDRKFEKVLDNVETIRRLLKSTKIRRIELTIFGAIHPNFKFYFENIFSLSQEINKDRGHGEIEIRVKVLEDVTNERVTEIVQESDFAILYFKDSIRIGSSSTWVYLIHGRKVISSSISREMNEIVGDFLGTVENVLRNKDEFINFIDSEADFVGLTNRIPTFDKISEQYNKIFNNVSYD